MDKAYNPQVNEETSILTTINMPLPKRLIEPVNLDRSARSDEENSETIDLDTGMNIKLSNIIRQLSSLSKHSDNLFDELGREAVKVSERTKSLQSRIVRLAIKITPPEAVDAVEAVEAVEADEAVNKVFKSSKKLDQQLFTRETMPSSMLELYEVKCL